MIRSSAALHRLDRLRLCIDVPLCHADRMSAEFSTLFNRKLRALIAAVLDRVYQESGEVLVAESLILDLGEFPLVGFQNSFCQRLEQLLLQLLINNRRTNPLTVKTAVPSTPSGKMTPFSHYLCHGYWPASEPLPDLDTLDIWLLDDLAAQPLRSLPILASHCLHLSNLLRLYRSLQPATLTRLCLYLANLHSISEPVTQTTLQLCALRYFQLHPQGVLPLLQQDEPVCVIDGNEQLLVRLFSDYDSASVALTTRLQKLWQQSAVRSVLELHLAASAYQGLQSRLDPSAGSAVTSIDKTRGNGSSNGNPSINHNSVVESKPISVNNGGITLLWPLLPGLLEQLGLMEKSKFIHSQAQVDAVCWLDELIWGDGNYAEWRMPLNKLLCGLPLDAPLEWTQPDAHALEVMQHWLLKLPERLPTWKNFGVSDIRQLYLQRPAWLVPTGDNFTLYIQPEVYDVLLADWPWPTEILKLPWLIKPLVIHWCEPSIE